MIDADARRLTQAAEQVAARAHAPYSRFHVGAIAVTDVGEIAGVNVENAAYGSTICAEASAIAAAVSAGATRIDAIAVASPDARDCYPCGNCRQLMREFLVNEVVVVGGDDAPVVYSLDDLLPHGFGPENLGR